MTQANGDLARGQPECEQPRLSTLIAYICDLTGGRLAKENPEQPNPTNWRRCAGQTDGQEWESNKLDFDLFPTHDIDGSIEYSDLPHKNLLEVVWHDGAPQEFQTFEVAGSSREPRGMYALLVHSGRITVTHTLRVETDVFTDVVSAEKLMEMPGQSGCVPKLPTPASSRREAQALLQDKARQSALQTLHSLLGAVAAAYGLTPPPCTEA